MFKIGFTDFNDENSAVTEEKTRQKPESAPRASLVQVRFPERHGTDLAYYNDSFDLHVGDMVYVEGKLEGLRGFVTEVSYNFRIRVSDYRRVTAVVDTEVKGQLFLAGSHLVCFDRNMIPYQKVRGWFGPPGSGDEEYVSGFDDSSFPLDDLRQMDISRETVERGHGCYMESRVRWLCVDGTHGRAIVEGRRPYRVEFEYRDGQISRLTCSCFCTGICKHEFAVMLQLRETLEVIDAAYEAQYEKSGYFAAAERDMLLSFALGRRGSGSITLD